MKTKQFILSIIGLFFLSLSNAYATSHTFISIWQIGASDTITIPTHLNGDYNYDIYWGDDSSNTYSTTTPPSHTYASIATLATTTITISGTFTRIDSGSNPATRLISVEQWGDVGWTSMANAFNGAANLTSVPNTSTGLVSVTDMSNMFNGASSFNGNINSWNVLAVTDMSSMFANATVFNQNIGSWNVSAVTNTSGMFSQATSFNANINRWNVSAVTDMSSMFSQATSFNTSINSWNVLAVTDMSSMFASATMFNQDISGWNVSAVDSMTNMFSGATAFNQNLGKWYITLLDTTINTRGATLRIQTQNDYLTRQGVAYELRSATANISINNGVLRLATPSLIDGSYEVIIHATGQATSTRLFGTNPATLSITLSTIRTNIISTTRTFNSVWQTSSPNEAITIPIHPSGTYNYTIYCGDGGVSVDGFQIVVSYATSSVEPVCSYPVIGTHTIEIGGTFTMINNPATQLISIEQWGDVGWDSMENAFNGAASLTSVPTNTIGLENVANMSGMFSQAVSFDSDISSWNISAVTNTSNMFSGATAFNADISGWDVSAVDNMTNMFSGATTFNANQNLGKWYIVPSANMINTQDATLSIQAQNNFLIEQGATYTFLNNADAFSITASGTLKLATPNFANTSYTITIQASGSPTLFGVAPTTETLVLSAEIAIPTIDAGTFISVWQTSASGTSEIVAIPVATTGTYNYTIDCGIDGESRIGFQVSRYATNTNPTCAYTTPGTHTIAINGTFPRIISSSSNPATKLISIEQWGTVGWTSMENAFNSAASLTSVPNNTTGLTSVVNMSNMFKNASSFNSDIGSWDVSAVTDMTAMFNGATSFNAYINNWTVSAVMNTSDMFNNAIAFNQDIGNWNLAAVTNMSSMFASATTFNQDIGSWTISSATNTSNMFNNATAFNADISRWDVSNVEDMSNMFNNAISFNADVNGWDVSSVTNINNIFDGATAFNNNQNLGNWYISLSATSIVNDIGATISLSTLSPGLNNPTYTIIGGDSRFSIDGNTLQLDARNPGATSYMLNISSTRDWGSASTRRIILNTTPDANTATRTTDFVTTWRIGGTPYSRQYITILDNSSSGYNIDCGEGGEVLEASRAREGSNRIGNTVCRYSEAGDYSVRISGHYPQFRLGSVDNDNLISIDQWGNQRWETMQDSFKNANNLRLLATDTPDLSNVTNMSGMFANTTGFNGNINDWNVANVTNMSGMFANASSLNGTINDWNVANVTNMSNMFANAGGFNGNISTWNVANVTNMSSMFAQAAGFTTDISGWDVSSVTNMSDMFASATTFNSDIGNWNVLAVTNMSSMFANASAFNQDISNWIISSATNTNNMFSNATDFNIDISGWDVSQVVSMTDMFFNDNNFNNNQNLGQWYITAVNTIDASGGSLTIEAQNDFLNAQNAMYALIGSSAGTFTLADGVLTLVDPDIEVGSYTIMIAATGSIFGKKPATANLVLVTDVNILPTVTSTFISVWQTNNASGTSEVITIPVVAGNNYNYVINCGVDGQARTSFPVSTYTNSTAPTCAYNTSGEHTIEINGTFPRIYFNNETTSNQLIRIERWGTVGWDSMENAFYGAASLTSVPSTSTGLENVTNMSNMFKGATNFNSDIGGWDVSRVTDMSGMFAAAAAFNQNIGNWGRNTSSVTDMSDMFADATSFNGNIGLWDTSSATNTSGMFANATDFNQNIGNGSSWTLSAVTNMNNMFNGATDFNADISTWDVSSVTYMSNMFNNATDFNANIGIWDVSKVANMSGMFASATVFNQDINGWNVSAAASMTNMFSGAIAFNGDQNLGNWYIVPTDLSIINRPNSTININTQNDFLTNQSPSYTITDASSSFKIINNILTLVTPTRGTNTYYTINLAAATTTGGFGYTRTREITVTIQRSFVSVWQTTTTGSSHTITIPVNASSSYNYTLNCGESDAVVATSTSSQLDGQTGDAVCHYATAGTKTISISGEFTRLNLGSYANKLVSIEYWGNVGWTSMANAFNGAVSLTFVPTNTIGLENVTNMANMFTGATNFNSDISSWDVSAVTNMSNMFDSAGIFNQNIGSWNISAVTNTSNMFNDATAFNANINDWDTSSVADMSAMFSEATSFAANIGSWTISSVTNMSDMFSQAASFTADISSWNVSAVTDMSSMFAGAVVFNQDISNWDVSAVTDMSSIFNGATAFNQNLGKWYIVLAKNSIVDFVNARIAIAAQNNYLNGVTLTYGIVDGTANFGVANNRLVLNVPTGQNSYGITLNVAGDGLLFTGATQTISVTLTINPASRVDSDGDGIPDDLDDNTNTNTMDSDGNLVSDNLETYLRSLGITATITASLDSDNDGIPDATEVRNGTDPLVSNGSGDANGNGVTDALEAYLSNLGIKVSTNTAAVSDVDKDLIPDAVEVAIGANPLLAADKDYDNDGLSDAIELYLNATRTSTLTFASTNSIGDLPIYAQLGFVALTSPIPMPTTPTLPTPTLPLSTPTLSSTAATSVFDWMTTRFNVYNAVSVTVGATDTDGDGASNTIELLSGSNPFINNGIAPTYWLSLQQGDNIVASLGRAAGTASIIANRVGGQAIGTSTFAWNIATTTISGVSSITYDFNTISFSVSNAATGNYSVQLEVTFVNSDGITSTYGYTLPVVITSSAIATADRDNDGIADMVDGDFSVGLTTIADYEITSEDPALIIRAGSTVINQGTGTERTAVVTDEQLGDNADTGNTHIGGTIDMEISGMVASATVKIIIALAQPIPEYASYRKLDVNNIWQDFDATTGDGAQSAPGLAGDCSDVTAWGILGTATTGDNCVRLTLTDGGDWDRDGIANGVIVDPFGITSTPPAPVEPTPTTPVDPTPTTPVDPTPTVQGGSSGGGCVLAQTPNSNKGIDPMFYLLFALALIGLLRRKSSHHY